MKLPKHFMGLIFLVMALDLTATGMGFLGKAFGEGTYFYWNIESSRIWPSPSRTDEGSVLTEVPDVGETIQIQIFDELVCRARINQLIKPRFVAELMRIECSSDGYVTVSYTHLTLPTKA